MLSSSTTLVGSPVPHILKLALKRNDLVAEARILPFLPEGEDKSLRSSLLPRSGNEDLIALHPSIEMPSESPPVRLKCYHPVLSSATVVKMSLKSSRGQRGAIGLRSLTILLRGLQSIDVPREILILPSAIFAASSLSSVCYFRRCWFRVRRIFWRLLQILGGLRMPVRLLNHWFESLEVGKPTTP